MGYRKHIRRMAFILMMLFGSGLLLLATLLPPFALIFPEILASFGPAWKGPAMWVLLITGGAAAIFGMRSLWVLVGWLDAGVFPKAGEPADAPERLLRRGSIAWGWLAVINALSALFLGRHVDVEWLALAMISFGFAIVLSIAWRRTRSTGSGA